MTKTFGSEIRVLRKERKLTLRDLSQKSGIEITYLSKIENNRTGGKSTELTTIDKLADALNIDINTREELYLLGKQIPRDFKDKLTDNKLVFEACRSIVDLNKEQLEKMMEYLKKK